MPSYEELVGGMGRAIAYRAERHLAREFITQGAATLICFGQQFSLYDLAMNGISIEVPADDDVWEPETQATGTLLIHGSPVYRGPMRVARVEPSGRRKRIGLQLLRGFIDLPEIRRQDDQTALAKALDDGPEPLRDKVPADYREVMERAAFFLQFYKQTLDRQEARFRAQGADGAPALAAMTRQALGALRRRWQEIRHEAALAAQRYEEEPDIRRAMRRYTETLVTPLLLEAPVLRRAFEKPLSYPGDYQVMLYIYNNALEGASAFGQVLHKLSVDEPLAAGVRGRRDFLKELIADEHRRYLKAHPDTQTPFRAANIGAGPAKEVAAFIEEHRRWPGWIHWTLIDQEERTLSLAYQTLFRELALNNSPGSLRCLYVSFKQIISDPESMLKDEPQDLIYAAGIFDYLGKSRAKKLIEVLYSFLAPGGLLAIGNALGPNTHAWTTEYGLDWSLIYRTRDEMEALAGSVPDPASVEVVTEPMEAYYFLLVRKP